MKPRDFNVTQGNTKQTCYTLTDKY